MQIEKDKIKGIIGTIIFHAILVLALIWLALTTPLPLPSEGGVEVNLGNSDEGMGTIQPLELDAAAAPAPPPARTEPSDEMLTQDIEEAPVIEPKKEVKPKPIERPEPKPVVKQEPTPVPPPKVNPKALFPGKSTTGSNTGQGGNEGTTGQPGDQGKVFGDPNAKGYDGTGGSGGGPGGVGGGTSFSLAGRSVRSLPAPTRNFSNEGTVVVSIWVNRAGHVTRAVSGAKGTTTSNTQLHQLAKTAAEKARFDPKSDAPEEQKGTITYHFDLN